MPEVIDRSAVRAASADSAGLLIALLERYADSAEGRSEAERRLARGIAAYPDGPAKVQAFVRKWRALPDARRAELVGPDLARAGAAARLDLAAVGERLRANSAVLLADVRPGMQVTRSSAVPDKAGLERFEAPPEVGAVSRGVRIGAVNPRLDVREEVARALHARPSIVGDPATRVLNGGGGAPMYSVECAGIYCQKESSWDQGSSHDEIYSCFSMYGDGDHFWSARTIVYKKMDSGDDWRSDPDPLFLLWPGPLPAETFYISTVMAENDYGDPNTVQQTWHDAAVVAACGVKYGFGVDLPQAVIDAAANLLDKVFGFGDDLMSGAGVVLTPGAIAWWAEQPLRHFKVQLTYHFHTTHTNGDAIYHTFYRVRRCN